MSHGMRSIWLQLYLGLSAMGWSGAEISTLKLGGSGLGWSANDTSNVLIDFAAAPGAIQPVYLRPDRTAFSYLNNWSALRDPRELGFVDGERPRMWRGWRGDESPNSNGTYLVDGDSTSINISGRAGDYYTIDLAVPVPAFRFGFFTPPRGFRLSGTPLSEDVVPAFEITIAEEGTPNWLENLSYQRIGAVIADVRENFSNNVQIEFPTQYVRYIRYLRKESAQDRILAQSGSGAQNIEGDGTIGDFEFFAEGIPKVANYVSQIFSLEREANFGRLFFAATPMRMVDGEPVPAPEAAASLKIEARTGWDDDPNIYYEYTNTGKKRAVSRQRYEFELKPPHFSGGRFQEGKPGIRAAIAYDTENWTYWSHPFVRSGQALGLEGGAYLQLKIALESGVFADFIRLDSLWVEQSPLLARLVAGEVARLDDPRPARGFTQVELGEPVDFVYAIKADFDDAAQEGFDALRISTHSQATFRGLEVGEPPRAVEPAQVAEEERGLVVYLPQKISRARNLPLRVVFGSRIFVPAQTFEAEVFAREGEGLPQPVQPGDVAVEVTTNSLRVFAAAESSRKLIEDLRFSTAIVTPNGDGINDQLVVSYSLFRLPEPIPVELNVRDLRGVSLVRVDLGRQRAGQQQVAWDGRDEEGARLAPGLYLVDIAIKSAAATFRQVRPIGIAY